MRDTGFARGIWLHIAKEGGTWTPDEIAQQFNVPRQTAALAMHNLTTRAKSLTRYKDRGRAKFGVTRVCRIPYGLTVQELAEVGVIPLEVQ